MTMIAFAAYPNHAELITDTTSYTVNGSALGQCTKHLALPHLDALVATQGASDFGNHAKMALWQAAAEVSTFDDLVAGAPGWLQQCREAVEDDGDAFVVLVGHSPTAGRFAAHVYDSDTGFEAGEVTGTWAFPMPWTARPTSLELARARRHHKPGADPVKRRVLLNTWSLRAPLPDHHGPDQWRHLAATIREQRALSEYDRVFVAGSVLHTRLERGSVNTTRIHDFNDEGEEFLKMIEWTFHPIAQLMECWCGSGKTYLACHLEPVMDEPCTCGTSGRTFRECCAVTATPGLPQLG